MGVTTRPSLAEAVGRLGTEGAFAVLARARALEATGRDVIHLEIGEPDFETPAHVAEAGIAAIRAGETHYCQTAGLPVLREAAAASLTASRHVAIDPEHVLVANGAKPFLFFTVLATCGPGDEVVYPDPGFPIYESAIRFAGATPVPLPLREERGFSFDPLELEQLLTERTRLVILNAPQNPTGAVVPLADLELAAAAIVRTPAWVLTDEVYSRITYDVEAPSIASLPGMLDRTILLDGFSKTFAMTGWRLGYAAVPGELVDPLMRLIVNSTSCVPPFAQLAGVAALEGPQDAVHAMVAEFRRRRDFLVPALNEIPAIRCVEPGGAFYAFPNVSELPLGADELADRLLDEAGVALLAGSAFGAHGADHLRISYASSLESLEQAVDRIRGFVSAL
jgi:aspartate/methionine/tyrosine aminotransferase